VCVFVCSLNRKREDVIREMRGQREKRSRKEEKKENNLKRKEEGEMSERNTEKGKE
jgi:hypothetical protein